MIDSTDHAKLFTN